jgi:hypothetical protein
VRKKGLEVIDHRGNKVAPEAVDWSVSYNNFPYMLRQPPGPKNALGQVKFMFPNRHSVYLHDTPNRNLFGKAQRTFSSGCVRVEQPFELAELLLDDPKWTPSRFESVLGSKRPATVHLKKPIPVILSYWTAEADAQGSVRFREDIYGRDEAVLTALDGNGPVRIVYKGEDPGSSSRKKAARTVEVAPGPEQEGALEHAPKPIPKSGRLQEVMPESLPADVAGDQPGPDPQRLVEVERAAGGIAAPAANAPAERIAGTEPAAKPKAAKQYGTDLPGEGPLFNF